MFFKNLIKYFKQREERNNTSLHEETASEMEYTSSSPAQSVDSSVRRKKRYKKSEKQRHNKSNNSNTDIDTSESSNSNSVSSSRSTSVSDLLSDSESERNCSELQSSSFQISQLNNSSSQERFSDTDVQRRHKYTHSRKKKRECSPEKTDYQKNLDDSFESQKKSESHRHSRYGRSAFTSSKIKILL